MGFLAPKIPKLPPLPPTPPAGFIQLPSGARAADQGILTSDDRIFVDPNTGRTVRRNDAGEFDPFINLTPEDTRAALGFPIIPKFEAPTPPAPPPIPPSVPRGTPQDSPEVQARQTAREQERLTIEKKARGRRSSIVNLGGALGLLEKAPTVKKTLLGQ